MKKALIFCFVLGPLQIFAQSAPDYQEVTIKEERDKYIKALSMASDLPQYGKSSYCYIGINGDWNKLFVSTDKLRTIIIKSEYVDANDGLNYVNRKIIKLDKSLKKIENVIFEQSKPVYINKGTLLQPDMVFQKMGTQVINCESGAISYK